MADKVAAEDSVKPVGRQPRTVVDGNPSCSRSTETKNASWSRGTNVSAQQLDSGEELCSGEWVQTFPTTLRDRNTAQNDQWVKRVTPRPDIVGSALFGRSTSLESSMERNGSPSQQHKLNKMPVG